MPPHMQSQRSTGNSVSSATEALFPSESRSEVAAKSPTRKNDQIKNVYSKSGGKTALMPPSHKVLQNRHSSSTPNPTSQEMTRNVSAGAVTPNPYPSTDNSGHGYSYRHGNSLPRYRKKSWTESNSASVDETRRHPREVTKKTAMMPPGHKMRSMTPNPQLYREPYTPAPIKLSSDNDSKAREDFSRLVQDQHHHVEDQRNTLTALDNNIKSILDAMQKRERDVEVSVMVWVVLPVIFY